jgi:transcriptional regulator with XRE-family HTH domain
MPSRIGRVDEAGIHGRRLQAELGVELRTARLAAGLHQKDVGRAVGVSHARISRVEHGHLRDLAVADLARHGAAVGLRLHARFYPSGSHLRDAGQLELLRRFRARIGDRWSWQLEAPLDLPGDLRAFDALLTRGSLRIAVEAITRLRDAQAQIRAAMLKQRDGRVNRLVLLVGATRHNRAALEPAAELLVTSFPVSMRRMLAGLAAGKDPGDNGIVLL